MFGVNKQVSFDSHRLFFITEFVAKNLYGMNQESCFTCSTIPYPELDPKTRILTVRLLVQNPDRKLNPICLPRCTFMCGPKQDVLKIPREALIITGQRESVIVDLGKGRFKPVSAPY